MHTFEVDAMMCTIHTMNSRELIENLMADD